MTKYNLYDMKVSIIICLILITLLSCTNRFESRQYKSLDEYTGGFNVFELNLKEDGKFDLNIETSRPISSDSFGDTWSVSSNSAHGEWKIERNNIICNFYDAKSSIDSVFNNSEFGNLKQNNLLYFSRDHDTAYIYGVPCPRMDRKN